MLKFVALIKNTLYFFATALDILLFRPTIEKRMRMFTTEKKVL